MDNSKNMEPGIKDTAAFDSTNKESKKKESRPVISAKAQTILVVSAFFSLLSFANH